jgi:cytidine deaminase
MGEGVTDDLLAAANAARDNAHATYSRFAVGVAIRVPSGKIFSGANVEVASFPEGWCAETSAIGAMVTAGETEIAEVLVVAEHDAPITPCGGCRQRLAEFGRVGTPVHSAEPGGVRVTYTLGELIPHAFGLKP